MANIRETDLMKYIVDEFNKNSLNIEFRMGTYDYDTNGLIVYAPPRQHDGRFDEKFVFDTETYQVTKKSMVVMGIDSMNGDYTPLPNIQLASYDFNLNFLVYADSQLYQVILMAIREIRDSFVGKVSTMIVKERVVNDLSEDAVLQTETIKLVTSADSIDLGSPIEIRKTTYLDMSFPLTITVSKNIEFGNQFEWKIGKIVNGEELEKHTVIPLLSSWGTAQDQESFQLLKPFDTTISDKAKEIHNYVKSRGYAITQTFLFDYSQYIIAELFKESFQKIETPNVYFIEQKFKYINNLGVVSYPSDMQVSRYVVLDEIKTGDVSFNAPVVFSVGFSPSAKGGS